MKSPFRTGMISAFLGRFTRWSGFISFAKKPKQTDGVEPGQPAEPESQGKRKGRSERSAARTTTLPLGIDIGSTGIRIVLNAVVNGEIVPSAILEYDGPMAPAGEGNEPDAKETGRIIRDMLSQNGIREKRCVFGVSKPVGLLEPIRVPDKVPKSAQMKSVYMTLERNMDFERKDVIMHVDSLGDGAYLAGAIRKSFVANRREIAKAAGLRVVAIDDESLAWLRAVPGVSAILDVGPNQARLSAYKDGIPQSWCYATGGDDDYLQQTADKILELRQGQGGVDIRQIALVGSLNINEAAAFVHSSTRCETALVQTMDPRTGQIAYSPPWLLAYGLACWSRISMAEASEGEGDAAA